MFLNIIVRYLHNVFMKNQIYRKNAILHKNMNLKKLFDLI